MSAASWLMRGAQAGSSEAMVMLGQRFENGDSVGQDLNQAGQLYSAAAKLGDPAVRYVCVEEPEGLRPLAKGHPWKTVLVTCEEFGRQSLHRL